MTQSMIYDGHRKLNGKKSYDITFHLPSDYPLDTTLKTPDIKLTDAGIVIRDADGNIKDVPIDNAKVKSGKQALTEFVNNKLSEDGVPENYSIDFIVTGWELEGDTGWMLNQPNMVINTPSGAKIPENTWIDVIMSYKISDSDSNETLYVEDEREYKESSDLFLEIYSEMMHKFGRNIRVVFNVESWHKA